MISELRGQYRDAGQEEATLRRQGVAADVSRRHLRCEKNAPTDLGGYTLSAEGGFFLPRVPVLAAQFTDHFLQVGLAACWT